MRNSDRLEAVNAELVRGKLLVGGEGQQEGTEKEKLRNDCSTDYPTVIGGADHNLSEFARFLQRWI
jgi:hypothetical protein